jgi:predicted GTPase
MKLNLLSCDAPRPDRRAIAKCIAEISSNISESLSNELTDILLEGDPVDIEMKDKNAGSILRALRKLSIDYEIIE